LSGSLGPTSVVALPAAPLRAAVCTLMSLALHDRLIGRPGRAERLAKLLDDVLKHDRV
jgi:hypothetical protein